MYKQVLIVSVLCVLVNNGDASIFAKVMVVPKIPIPEKGFVLPYITGAQYPNLNISYINFTGTDTFGRNRAILTLSDFPDLLQVDMNKLSLGRLPNFSNVPKLNAISAYGNRLRNIVKDWFADTPLEILILESNRIKKIDDGAFGDVMSFVDLSCNELTEISAKWFRKPGRMELFSLRSNKITTLPASLLRKFTNLTELDLSYNQIVTVGPAALTGPRIMNTLDLSVNLITELPANVMQNSKHYIQYMFLSYNRLNFLEASLLDKLEVVEFRIYGNPWHCTCLQSIEHWMTEKGVICRQVRNASDPICIYPLSYADKCIETVDNELYRSYVKSLNPPPPPKCV